MFANEYNCLNKYIDTSCNECYKKDSLDNEICNRRYERFENRHNKYEYVHCSSRLERLKYDTIMRTNIKNREKLNLRKAVCKKYGKYIKTDIKNGRYPGTKMRFTGWMFNKYHPEMKKGVHYKKDKNGGFANKNYIGYSDFNSKVRAQKQHCCKNYDYNAYTKKRFNLIYTNN